MPFVQLKLSTAALSAAFWCMLVGSIAAQAQAPNAGPPAVGVVEATKQPIVETEEFIGRIESPERVNIVARVTAFVDKQLFTDGSEVKKGKTLYQLERGPFEADVAAKQAAVAQQQASLENARLTTERAQALLTTPAGQRSTYDAALAAQRSLEAQVQAAQAQLQVSQINLGYTDIKSPIDGKIGQTAVTAGNVVSPSSGVLATIVSQDPMYVSFPVPLREALQLRQRYAPNGGFNAVVIRIRLPDGRAYGSVGHLDFVNNAIATNTDTLTLRGTIPNPPIFSPAQTHTTVRELFDGEFVSVLLQGAQPIEVVAIPRAAVLSDQQGDYVYVVGSDNKAQQHRIHLGQSSSTTASVMSGLSAGDRVIVEGLQRVQPGETVAPGPASASAIPTSSPGGGVVSGSDNGEPSGEAGGGAPKATANPPGPVGSPAPASGSGSERNGTTAKAPATVSPPAGQAAGGTAGGAHPSQSGGPSARH